MNTTKNVRPGTIAHEVSSSGFCTDIVWVKAYVEGKLSMVEPIQAYIRAQIRI